MRKILFTLLIVASCTACENPEDYAPKVEKQATTNGANTGSTAAPDSNSASGTTGAAGGGANTPQAAVDPNRDSSPSKTVDVKAEQFDTVTINGGGEVEINVGKPYRVTIECNEKSLPHMKVAESGTSLNISTDRNFHASIAKVTVDTPKLSAINADGTMLVKVNGITGETIKISGTGSTLVDANGTVDELTASGAGASLLRLNKLEVKRATVTAADKSCVEVNCSEKVGAKGSGNAVITISGKPIVTKESTDKAIINAAGTGKQPG